MIPPSDVGARTPARIVSRASIGRSLRAWPRQCEVCRHWGRQPVCGACVERFAPRLERCPLCALPLAAGRVCGACLQRAGALDRVVAAVDYRFPWDALITRFKFRAQPELAACLAERLLAAIDAADAPAPELLVPVPLGPQRMRERGYNQAWELARRLAAARGVAADAGVLVRGRDTPHQIGLDRAARAANLRGSLWVDPRALPRIAGRRVAVVDDVMTTGATAEAAAHALRRAGAGHVQLWVVARTP